MSYIKYDANHCLEYQREVLRTLEKLKTRIWKEFTDMDFENADLRYDYEELVREMLRDVQKEITILEATSFLEYNYEE